MILEYHINQGTLTIIQQTCGQNVAHTFSKYEVKELRKILTSIKQSDFEIKK